VDFPERTCQPAAAQLWGSRNIEHKKNDISFILNPMAMEFLRDMCKDMKHIVVEGHGHWSDGTTGGCMPTGRNSAAGQQGHHVQEHL
jgi:hypothetical protein